MTRVDFQFNKIRFNLGILEEKTKRRREKDNDEDEDEDEVEKVTNR